jgi:hypothetical protein
MIAPNMRAITSAESALVTPAAGGEERPGSGTWAPRWNSRSEPHVNAQESDVRDGPDEIRTTIGYGRWASCVRASGRETTRRFTLQKSGRPDSNRRRPAWEAGILPTELRPRQLQNLPLSLVGEKAGLNSECAAGDRRACKPTPGFEPGTARLRIGCSTTELSRQVFEICRIPTGVTDTVPSNQPA